MNLALAAVRGFVGRHEDMVKSVERRLDAPLPRVCVASDLTVVGERLAAADRWGAGFDLGDDGGDFVAVEVRFGLPRVRRSALGSHSLFLRPLRDGVLVASDPHALFPPTTPPPQPNLERVATYLVGEYSEVGETLISGVYAVGAGDVLELGRSIPRCHADFPFPHTRPSTVEESRELLEQACARCAGDHSFVAVSGGLDSTNVAAALVRAGRRPQLRSLGYPGESYDESRLVRELARRLDAPCTIYPPEPPVWPVAAVRLGQIQHPQLREFATLQQQADGCVGMTGHGGDALFNTSARSRLLSLGRRGRLGWLPAARVLLQRATPLPWLQRRWTRTAWRTGLLTARYAALPAEIEVQREGRIRRSGISRAKHETIDQLRGELHFAAALLSRLGQAARVSWRHPFFDRDLVRHLLALPDEVRLDNSRGPKTWLREIGADLPPSIRDAVTKPRFDQAIRRSLPPVQWLRDGELVGRGLVRPEALDDVLSSVRLADLVSMELFLRSLGGPQHEDP